MEAEEAIAQTVEQQADAAFLFVTGGRGRAAEHPGARTTAMRTSGLARLIVNAVRTLPIRLPHLPSSTAGDKFDCEAIIELAPEMRTTQGWRVALDEVCGALPGASMCSALFTRATVEKDEHSVVEGSMSSGVKYLGVLQFHSDLGPDAGQRLWAHHTGLGLRAHLGMSRYVGHWVTSSLDEVLPAVAISELHFETEDDLVSRFFDSDRGREEVLHDTGHFIAQGHRFYTHETALIGRLRAMLTSLARCDAQPGCPTW